MTDVDVEKIVAKVEKSPSMPFYGKDAYDDEKFASMSYGAQGFFWRLAWWQWQEGDIPANIDTIIALRGKEKESRRLWGEVAPMFPSVNGGERRRNEYVEQLRQKLVSVRAKRQQAAYKRHANADIQHPIAIADAKEEAIANDVQSICDEFIDRPQPHPTEFLVSSWIEKIGVLPLRELLRRHSDKNAAYIDKCVETASLGRKRIEASVDPVALVYARIEAFIGMHGSRKNLTGEAREKWEAEFLLELGFAADEWGDHTPEKCSEWLAKLKVTA